MRPTTVIGTDEALALLRGQGFGVLVVSTVGGPPEAVHVPFLVEERDGRLRVELHVARANPIHQLIGDGIDALFICQGPGAYLSPDWYGLPNEVPTWAYEAVHLKGRARVLPLAAHLDHADRLSAFFEARLAPKKPWTSAKMDPKRRDAMLRAIVAIEIDVTAVEAQQKLLQHKKAVANKGAVAALRERSDPQSVAIADLIEKSEAE